MRFPSTVLKQKDDYGIVLYYDKRSFILLRYLWSTLWSRLEILQFRIKLYNVINRLSHHQKGQPAWSEKVILH